MAKEIMSKIYEKLASYEGKAQFSTWLYSISYNYCIDYIRQKKKVHYPNWNQEHDLTEIPEYLEDVKDDVDYDKLILVMDELHPEERALIQMKYMENLPLKSIANVMRITENATKMRLKRARVRLLFLYSKKYLSK